MAPGLGLTPGPLPYSGLSPLPCPLDTEDQPGLWLLREEDPGSQKGRQAPSPLHGLMAAGGRPELQAEGFVTAAGPPALADTTPNQGPASPSKSTTGPAASRGLPAHRVRQSRSLGLRTGLGLTLLCPA